MVSFISLFTWRLKLAIGIVLCAAAWWFVQREKTHAFEQGIAHGQQQLLSDQAKQLETKSKQERATIDHERARLETQANAITSERNALTVQQRQLGIDFERNLAQLTLRDKEIRNETTSILDSDLVPHFREALSHIRTREQSRTAQ